MEKQDLIALIYDEVNAIIGGGNQLFCMQFPAQPLNAKMYDYDTSSRNSVLTKPYPVAEAEFRLADQLFDVSTMSASSNGEKLSTNYNTMLNNLIPKLDYLAPFMKDRASMGKWLLESSGRENESGVKLSRIELCKKLYLEYLEAKNAWNKLKDKTFDDYKGRNDLDGYAKWQSSQGLVETEKLNNLYNDVVVSGHLHEVLTILGYLNASSIAEELEISKQKLRNSSRLSLDESMTVYPVQFSPNNWFKALTPNINPQDLTMTVDSIRSIYLDKQRELSRAKSELAQYELIRFSDEEIKKLELEVEKSRKELSEEETKLINQYTQSAFSVAKLIFKAYSVTTGAGLTTEMIKYFGGDESKEEEYKKIIKEINDTQKHQSSLNAAIGNLTNLKAKKAEMQSKDFQLKKIAVQQRINELEADISYYSNLLAETTISKNDYGFTLLEDKKTVVIPKEIHPNLTVTYNKEGNPKTDLFNTLLDQNLVTKVNEDYTFAKEIKDVKLWIESPALINKISEEDAELEGMFSDVVIKTSKSTSKNEDGSHSYSSASSKSINGWFTSYKSTSSTASASESHNNEFFDSEMEIGFRVAKVSFDRGSWFNPQFFKMNNAFTKLSDIKLSNGLSKEDVLNNTILYQEYNKTKDYILPAFPVALVIAKDITVKVKTTQSNSSAMNSIIESERASSGGFLCFSSSSASSSKNSSNIVMSGSEGEYFYIKVPGPQVLGYYLQMVPSDKDVSPYEPIIKEDGSNEIMDALNGFNVDIINKNHPLDNA